MFSSPEMASEGSSGEGSDAPASAAN
eukprot:COSAG06_NODE_50897_length_315_cov_1.203704_1_plen_25_part_10